MPIPDESNESEAPRKSLTQQGIAICKDAAEKTMDSKRTTWVGLVTAIVALVGSPDYIHLFPDNVAHYIAIGSTLIAAIGPRIHK